ncbi:MAG: hypothetical protein GY804_08580 [Alphaproteobacteria bacterium]|nr:hypothetical protein [Alphaproteobacteria bacterium]
MNITRLMKLIPGNHVEAGKLKLAEIDTISFNILSAAVDLGLIKNTMRTAKGDERKIDTLKSGIDYGVTTGKIAKNVLHRTLKVLDEPEKNLLDMLLTEIQDDLDIFDEIDSTLGKSFQQLKAANEAVEKARVKVEEDYGNALIAIAKEKKALLSIIE